MNIHHLRFFVVIIILSAGHVTSSDWRYASEEQWPGLCHTGKLQSPIALSESIAKRSEFPPLDFQNYDKEYPAAVKNNGHSAEIRLLIEDKPIVKGGGLPYDYQLDHIHFHWQSEHTIEQYRYPLEMHLVHYALPFGNVSSGLRHTNGIAVFSILFDLSPDDDGKFAPLIEVIGKVHDHVGHLETKNFDMKYYLPRDIAGFYRYNGSLTTPDCTEEILWTVFTNTLPISSNQVNYFKEMQDAENKEMPKNYRSLQALNGRNVYLKVSPIRNAAFTTINSYVILVLTSFIHIIYLSFY